MKYNRMMTIGETKTMTYEIMLLKSEEGYSVSCPGLPGCCSQGDTEEEAIENIQDAIREYLAARHELTLEASKREFASFREVEVAA